MGDFGLPRGLRQNPPDRKIDHVPTEAVPPRVSSLGKERTNEKSEVPRQRQHTRQQQRRHHLSDMLESPSYHQNTGLGERDKPDEGELKREDTLETTNPRYDGLIEKHDSVSKSALGYSAPTALLQRDVSLKHPRRSHISLREGQGFSLGRHHRRKPIAREWNIGRKKITATIACMNTMFIGLIAGIYVSLDQGFD